MEDRAERETPKNNGKSIRGLADSEVEEDLEKVQAMETVSGAGFCKISLSEWAKGYKTVGFQGTHLHQAIEELKRMRENGSKVFLGYTSNMISSGLRDVIAYLVRNKFVDVLVTTAGGVEEDIIKTLRPSRMGDFSMDGASLRSSGLNRVGNVLIPNENYFLFEEWMTSFLDGIIAGDVSEKCSEEVQGLGCGYRKAGDITIITPSRLIHEMGRKVECAESVYYWAHKNSIPVYCPAITDGSIGDIITYYKRRRDLVIDTVEDIARINGEGLFCESTGALVLGAGVVKHHILNANLFRNGLDHCVLVNTAQEYDGSDAGARVDEAVSWGKIKKHTNSVKVHADATIVLPILVGAVWPDGE
ncbi:deoxyhypusine synthase [Nematocida major]|uniref:deoxyhypusine synthase n=1 Tax=Nematocida major TaxID=1912982 RepID=UPI002007A60C|nr:deoxyhypusine synthase [Nematocida major]KAH9385740.1 deoxyhypusine synthase [Nematocida major]